MLFRSKAFYEIVLMKREANGSGVGNYFNSLGNTFDALNASMDARARGLNADALKKQYGSDGVLFNGPQPFVANGFTALAFVAARKESSARSR